MIIDEELEALGEQPPQIRATVDHAGRSSWNMAKPTINRQVLALAAEGGGHLAVVRSSPAAEQLVERADEGLVPVAVMPGGEG